MPGTQFTCSICGAKLALANFASASRDTEVCSTCHALKKQIEVAQAFLGMFGDGRAVSLSTFVREARAGTIPSPAILDLAYTSPFAPYFRDLPEYRRGYFWPSGKAEKTSSGDLLPFADLENLAFESAGLDAVITHDSLPFVASRESAWAEIARVLRPGGVLLASMVVDWPMPVAITDLSGDETRREHPTPDGKRMKQMWKPGADMAQEMSRHRLRPIFRRMSFMVDERSNYTIIGVRS